VQSPISREEILIGLKRFVDSSTAIRLAGIYGSFATEKARSNSDLDFAVAATHLLSFEEKANLAEQIAALVGREVDIVDLRDARGVIFSEISRDILWLCKKDEDLWIELLKRQLIEEADFTPLRERLLQKKRERFLKG
jgi:uncharacterized protein